MILYILERGVSLDLAKGKIWPLKRRQELPGGVLGYD